MASNKIKKPVSGGVAKVPIIMQMEALECGAAALAMVLAYYGKWVPLEQLRLDCGVSRDGSNARNIYRAAEQHGMKVEAFRRTPETLRESSRFPCIIHWNFNHFVVLRGFRGKYAYINDPARGLVRIDEEEFDRSFTGVVLVPCPGDNFQPSGKRRTVLDYANKTLNGSRSAVFFVLLVTRITFLFGVIQPILSKLFIDRLLDGDNQLWLKSYIILMAGVSVMQILTAWIQAIYSLRFNGKMAVMGSINFIRKILSLPLEFFSQRLPGDIQHRKIVNEGIAATLVNAFAPLLMNTVMMVFYFILMIKQNPVLTAISITAFVVNLLISRILSEKQINITRVMQRDTARLSSATFSGIDMIETIKSSGAEHGFFEKWAGYQASVNTQNIQSVKLHCNYGLLPSFLASFASYTVLIIGVRQVIDGNFTLGALQMFEGLLAGFMNPAMTLVKSCKTMQEMQTNIERIDDVMRYPSDVNIENDEAEDDIHVHKLKGHVELKNITFGYCKLEQPLLKDCSLEIKPGSRVAIVGTSGSGKSTLSKLISGLYTPWSGEILFDGQKRSEVPRSILTSSVAVVDQEIVMFEGRVSDNIKLWDESIDDFEMLLASRDASLHEEIMQRRMDYQSPVTSGGRNFSGGQRQRMEIARALAQEPTLLIMDEATSALDAQTEYDVVKAIRERGITCIIIAHRLSTVRDCDEIYVLDHGTIVDHGTHEELIQRGGIYTELVISD